MLSNLKFKMFNYKLQIQNATDRPRKNQLIIDWDCLESLRNMKLKAWYKLFTILQIWIDHTYIWFAGESVTFWGWFASGIKFEISNLIKPIWKTRLLDGQWTNRHDLNINCLKFYNNCN